MRRKKADRGDSTKNRKSTGHTGNTKNTKNIKSTKKAKKAFGSIVRKSRGAQAPGIGQARRRGREKRPAIMEPLTQSREAFDQRCRMILDIMEEKNYQPMRLREFAALLEVPGEQRPELAEVMRGLEARRKVVLARDGRYRLSSSREMTGVYCANARGFGFVMVEGRDRDVFIPAGCTGGAMQDDEVRIAVTEGENPDERAEGMVLEIVRHATDHLVGVYEKAGDSGFVIPDDPRQNRDVHIAAGLSMGAVSGHKVVVHLLRYGQEYGEKPEGEIVRILGHIDDPGVDILSIIAGHDLPVDVPPEVDDEVRRIPDHVGAAELQGRRDFRGLQTVTIDGDDTKDFDDAVTVERTAGGFRLGVHIADVSWYVRENSALDRDALRRGTSVYLTDRVIPMLPHQLSNGICSLNQGEDRLTLSCVLDYDPAGRLMKREICASVIRVDRRMTYNRVNAFWAGDPEAVRDYKDFADFLEQMKTLSHFLREQRKRRGAMEFDFPESHISLDAEGHVLSVEARERGEAERCIEDFMMAANEAVAEEFAVKKIPFLYRVHEVPDDEKISALAALAGNFGLVLHHQSGKVTPLQLAGLLNQAKGKAAEPLINMLVLRSMKQARYDVEELGHFGIAAKYYSHFTSPIRRYPDLQIHRIIHECLEGRWTPERKQHYEKILPNVAVQSSAAERRAEEAERDTDKLKKVQYMEQFVGEEMDGVITSVTGWGFYVLLPNTCEGLVHITELSDDYYIFDEGHYELRGRMTGHSYHIGQPVRVRLTGVDMMMKTIDFVPAGGRNSRQGS